MKVGSHFFFLFYFATSCRGILNLSDLFAEGFSIRIFASSFQTSVEFLYNKIK